MPRRNNRDKRFDPKDIDINQTSYGYGDKNSSKPKRKRKDKFDKKIYRENE